MRPEVSALGSTRHDLLVIGGGILGACLAWDAALRGLKVALVERGQLGGATSANSLRIIHGGLRYLVRGRPPRDARIDPGAIGPPADRSRPGPALPRRHPRRHSRLSQPNRPSPRPGPQRSPFRRPQSPPRSNSASTRGTDALRGGADRLFPGLGPLARAGEPYGLTPSCLAPNNLPGRLCARPQNTAAYWPRMRAQNISPAAEGGSSQWQSGIVRAGASRRLRPGKSFWSRARGPVSSWRGRLDRPWLHGRWLGTPSD